MEAPDFREPSKVTDDDRQDVFRERQET